MLIRAHLRIRSLVALVASMALATGMLSGGLGLGAPGTASAATGITPATGITICLTNASSYCADIKDGHNTSGTRIWLWNKSGAGDDHWIQQTVSCNIGTCFVFKDALNTNLCLSDPPGTSAIELYGCGPEYSEWYPEGDGHWGNVFKGAGATLSALPLVQVLV